MINRIAIQKVMLHFSKFHHSKPQSLLLAFSSFPNLQSFFSPPNFKNSNNRRFNSNERPSFKRKNTENNRNPNPRTRRNPGNRFQGLPDDPEERIKLFSELHPEIESEFTEPDPTWKKRKFVLLYGYLGTKYWGNQFNMRSLFSKDLIPNTVENQMLLAFIKSGVIDKRNFDLAKLGWSRSSRTDKGVHATSILSALKLLVEDNNDKYPPNPVNHFKKMTIISNTMTEREEQRQRRDYEKWQKGGETEFKKFQPIFKRRDYQELLPDPREPTNGERDLIDKINSNLPEDIKIFGVQRCRRGYDARAATTSRQYEYLLPLEIFCPTFVPKEGETRCHPIRVENILQKWNHDPNLVKALHYIDSSVPPPPLYPKLQEINPTLTNCKFEPIPEPAWESIQVFNQLAHRFHGTVNVRNISGRIKSPWTPKESGSHLDDNPDRNNDTGKPNQNRGKDTFDWLPDEYKTAGRKLEEYLPPLDNKNVNQRKDPRMLRYILNFGIMDHILSVSDTEKYVVVDIYGTSFVYHQIRKMIGSILAVMYGKFPPSFLEFILRSPFEFKTPLAPSFPLILAETHSESELLVWPDSAIEEMIRFKMDHIYPTVFQRFRDTESNFPSPEDTIGAFDESGEVGNTFEDDEQEQQESFDQEEISTENDIKTLEPSQKGEVQGTTPNPDTIKVQYGFPAFLKGLDTFAFAPRWQPFMQNIIENLDEFNQLLIDWKIQANERRRLWNEKKAQEDMERFSQK